MNKKNLLIIKKLKKTLIASCQPIPQGPLDKSDFILGLANASLIGGAKALRIEGFKNLKKVKSNVKVPIIGLKKRISNKFPIIITPLLKDVEKLANLGANIIAFDSTHRPRPYSVDRIISKIHSFGKIAMADCSNINDASMAIDHGADIISTTLSGYVDSKKTRIKPDFILLKSLIKKFNVPIIAEGRFNTPVFFKQALDMGAHAVVVGTALNRVESITKSFLDEL